MIRHNGNGWEGLIALISGAFEGNYTLNGDFEENEILLYPGEVHGLLLC